MKYKIKNDEYWAFIPARSGSKTIKNKNIKLINNLPLIAYSILTANKIKCKNVVFSSDSDKYLNIAKKYSTKIILHKRSKLSSTATATDLMAFREFCESFINNNESLPEFFIHLRPTTPFRNSKIVTNAINLFKAKAQNYTSMRSVYEMSNPSFKTFIIKNNLLCSLNGSDFNLDKYNIPKENFKKTYLPNGYIDIIKTKNILKNKFHGNKVLPFLIKSHVIDIDNMDDLKNARKLTQK